MQGKKQFTEKLFTNFQLSDRMPEDNFYRRLKAVLNLQWLHKATKKYYGAEGQQSIDPVVFLKLMLIGYLENLGSDRRIINTVSMRLDMLFFMGYDIDEQLPWHNTLSILFISVSLHTLCCSSVCPQYRSVHLLPSEILRRN